jgi:hypothetical protein
MIERRFHGRRSAIFWTALSCYVSGCFPIRDPGAPSGAVPWSQVSGIPQDLLDGDDVGECGECDTPTTATDTPDTPDTPTTGDVVDLPEGSTIGGNPIAVAGEPVPWSSLDDVPPGFADGDDGDALGGLICSAGAHPVWSGVAWLCSQPCPPGMVAVGDACVDVQEQGSADYIGASIVCERAGQRLCRAQELITACAKGVLQDATDNAEWAADFFAGGAYNGTRVLRTSCTGWTSDHLGSVAPYRCCRNVL